MCLTSYLTKIGHRWAIGLLKTWHPCNHSGRRFSLATMKRLCLLSFLMPYKMSMTSWMGSISGSTSSSCPSRMPWSELMQHVMNCAMEMKLKCTLTLLTDTVKYLILKENVVINVMSNSVILRSHKF